jgi:hypothetical protein
VSSASSLRLVVSRHRCDCAHERRAPLFVVDGEQDLLREAARYRVRSERVRTLAATLRDSLFPGDERVLCAHVRREAETLGCVPGRRYVVCPTPQGTVPTATH